MNVSSTWLMLWDFTIMNPIITNSTGITTMKNSEAGFLIKRRSRKAHITLNIEAVLVSKSPILGIKLSPWFSVVRLEFMASLTSEPCWDELLILRCGMISVAVFFGSEISISFDIFKNTCKWIRKIVGSFKQAFINFMYQINLIICTPYTYLWQCGHWNAIANNSRQFCSNRFFEISKHFWKLGHLWMRQRVFDLISNDFARLNCLRNPICNYVIAF